MNKTYLRQVFGHANSGYGYLYIGEIPDGVGIPEFVTSRYVELSGDNQATTIVSWSNMYNCALLYVPGENSNELISSEFELIDDLTPPAPELQVVEEDSSSNTESEITPE